MGQGLSVLHGGDRVIAFSSTTPDTPITRYLRPIATSPLPD